MLIYKVTNKINNKVYIGLTTTTLHQRRLEHERSKDQTHFHRAIKKYGKENFIWEILEECNDKEKLCELEKQYIKKYDSIKQGYNCTTGGETGYIQYVYKDRKGGNNPAARPIINLNTLQIFSCITEAAKFYGVSANNLGYVLNGKYKDCKGYKFDYYDENKKYIAIPLTKEKLKNSNSRKSVTNVTTGEIFKTISEAAEKYKCARKGIRDNCNGTRKDYNGYIWKYTNLE